MAENDIVYNLKQLLPETVELAARSVVVGFFLFLFFTQKLFQRLQSHIKYIGYLLLWHSRR